MKNANCSNLVKLSIPAIRYALARILIDKYTMDQSQIAATLGITQAAVNKYLLGKCSINISKLGAAILSNEIIDNATTNAALSGETEKLNKLIDRMASGKSMVTLIKKILGIEVPAMAM